MAAPQFTQSTGDPRLYWLDAASWSPSGGFGLVLFADTGAGPPALTLAQSFTDYPGAYVTIGQRPTAQGETAFADAVLALVLRLGPGARFFWLAQADPDADWGRRTLYIRQAAGAAQGLIDRPSVMALGRYRFTISSGQTLAPTADGFSIDGDVTPAFQLLTDDKTWPLAGPPAGQTVLAANGAAAGTFRLDLSLEASANPGGMSDFELLDVGLRYGLVDPGDPDGVLLKSLRQPLVRGLAPTATPMSLLVDPGAPLEPTRTHLAFGAGAPVLDTHYSAQLGYGVSLAPASNGGSGLPAGLAFHRRPASLTEAPGDDPLYLAPIGPFTLTVAAPSGGQATPAARLSPGLSGSEYFGFSTGQAVPVSYTPAQPAFAVNFPPKALAPSLTDEAALTALAAFDDPPPPLDARATTAFAALGPPAGGQAWYFAQPAGAAFFHVRETGSPSQDALLPYLPLLELVTSDVSAPGQAYPLTPYAGGDVANDLDLIRAFEAQVLSPMRRAAMGSAGGDQLFLRAPIAPEDDDGVPAVTPQGMLATFEGSTWRSVILSPAKAQTTLPQLAFNTPGADLRDALQANQLFLVAADGARLMTGADYNYWITDAVLGDLTRLTGAEAVPPSVVSLLAASARTPQTSRAAFRTMLDGVLTGPNAQYRDVVTKYAVYFQLEVEGWRFRLSPSLWADQSLHPPVMIFKFARGPLVDFVQNTDAWAWPEVAKLDGSISATQVLINQIITAAQDEVAAQGQASDLYNFVTQVVSDPGWTGVIVLNANVPFSSVPPELAGLAAGVDPAEFRAHHVGLSVTPVTVDTAQRSLAQDHSAVFGLIDYDDPLDIAHTSQAFDFKVLQLRVLFANSAIANFAARIELFVNQLFGELVTLYRSEHYNNILLDGAYQRQGGSGHYVFATSAVSTYGADAVGRGGSAYQTVLQSTALEQVQFVTATADSATQSIIRNRFLMRGKLRFSDLKGFDAFSFGPTQDRNGVTIADGYLAFSGLSVDMDFPVATPEARTFAFNIAGVAFDPAASLARPTSFFQRFPLQLAALIRGDKSQKPKDLGFMPLETPLAQPGFDGEWYGLVLAVDLGTLGALSAAPPLSASLVAAWSPAPRGHDVNIGLKLPGVESIRSLSPIQGVIDLGFQSIDLQAQGATQTPPDPAYTLRFRNFYLRFLGWKFPPGQNVITLFGNPDVASQSLITDRGALGWYAAYAKKE
ncbi:hypothetical protein [Caulobacter sp.]|uniref:hypothetical protein n=1 Tax=Caulobacter sp. TaxID=78 RepID=UPI002B48509B|nr:hypothetical protein [Caulobacter sp.]HJV41707.1 hypothetical protein [Caulobacter sp.]